jgi:hypothetical protein
MRSWLQPKSGDLLHDVIYLQKRAAKENTKTARGIYARAAIVMAVATIENIFSHCRRSRSSNSHGGAQRAQ